MSKRAALRLTDPAYQSSYTAKRMKKYILTSVSLFQNETSIVYSIQYQHVYRWRHPVKVAAWLGYDRVRTHGKVAW